MQPLRLQIKPMTCVVGFVCNKKTKNYVHRNRMSVYSYF